VAQTTVNVQHDAGGTLEAGLLVRHLHGELDAVAARAVAAHIAGCDACRTAAAAIAARTRSVSNALQAADFDQPSPGTWRAVREALRSAPPAHPRLPRLAIAALCVLFAVAAASMASATVRAWVADQWFRVSGEPAQRARATDANIGRAALAFRPVGPELQVTFETKQAAGTLTLRFTDEQTATVVVDGGAAEQLAVGGRSVHVANASGSRASFTVTLPQVVERVHVRIGTNDTVTLRRGVVDEGEVAIALDSGVVVRKQRARDDQ
jgi:hypothetical protein